ncbi:MAG TPA: hypothetical protein VLC12_03860, partial [Terriglobales bacterium]|nr:hypothetical protein [Terriglobales bacterium]
MNPFRMFPSLFLAVVLTAPAALASPATTLGNNAALRYWAAFSAMQDSDISAQDAKELNTILAGTAPYDDSKYRTVVEKNRLALKIMARGTRLRTCDWGLDYTMGEDLPVEYARKALALGRLNVLYSFHLLITGDKEGAADTLAAGLRFSQDVARGGSLFATLAAKDLLDSHFRAIAFALHVAGLSDAQKDELRKAAAQLGPEPLDWTSAAKRDLEGLRGRF